MPLQMTGGSASTWFEFDRYRQVGALARERLIRAAAGQRVAAELPPRAATWRR
jgi:hypothetical protein